MHTLLLVVLAWTAFSLAVGALWGFARAMDRPVATEPSTRPSVRLPSPRVSTDVPVDHA